MVEEESYFLSGGLALFSGGSRFLVSRLLQDSFLFYFRDEESQTWLCSGCFLSFSGMRPSFLWEGKEIEPKGEKIALFVRPFPEEEKKVCARPFLTLALGKEKNLGSGGFSSPKGWKNS